MAQTFRELVKDKEALSLPQFKKFSEEAQKRLNDLNALLLNDESLLNEKGIAISRERKLWRLMLTSFDQQFKDAAIQTLLDTIDHKLKS